MVRKLKELKTKRIGLVLTEKQFVRLKTLSEQDEVTMTDFIMDLIKKEALKRDLPNVYNNVYNNSKHSPLVRDLEQPQTKCNRQEECYECEELEGRSCKRGLKK